MARIRDLASIVRSKNAGPYKVTIDVMFAEESNYTVVVLSGVLNPATLGPVFGLPADEVTVTNFRPALAIKITIPRAIPGGGPDDRDVAGGQQFAGIVDLEVGEGSVCDSRQ